MLLKEIAEKLSLKTFTPQVEMAKDVKGGYTSDLLSDVMGASKEGDLWITLQTHKNIVAVASLRELSAIILVKGFEPDRDTVEAATAENIPLLGTDLQTFEISGRLYNLLK
ncbi:MAG: DRTGG domain-containing protein [Bacteroidales bacterium]|nr:DRTGG domain-containing protein [Bacteroidales bacterium]MDD2424684.1 DRTGG domain-containing protein [Bacteroidales bacterium]MDD3989868.1 DRTGG domain-containing protein [Bacteroidales bacterium]MDD4638440.1 DRTGG domain-containing protein [Bacteroidales bacterium]